MADPGEKQAASPTYVTPVKDEAKSPTTINTEPRSGSSLASTCQEESRKLESVAGCIPDASTIRNLDPASDYEMLMPPRGSNIAGTNLTHVFPESVLENAQPSTSELTEDQRRQPLNKLELKKWPEFKVVIPDFVEPEEVQKWQVLEELELPQVLEELELPHLHEEDEGDQQSANPKNPMPSDDDLSERDLQESKRNMLPPQSENDATSSHRFSNMDSSTDVEANFVDHLNLPGSSGNSLPQPQPSDGEGGIAIPSAHCSYHSKNDEDEDDIFFNSFEESLASSAPGSSCYPHVVGTSSSRRRNRSLSLNLPLTQHQLDSAKEIGQTLRRLSDEFDDQMRLRRRHIERSPPASGTGEDGAAGTGEDGAAGTAEDGAAGTAEDGAAGTAEGSAAGTGESCNDSSNQQYDYEDSSSEDTGIDEGRCKKFSDYHHKDDDDGAAGGSGSLVQVPVEIEEQQPEPVAQEQPEPVAQEQPEPVAQEQPEPIEQEQPEPVEGEPAVLQHPFFLANFQFIMDNDLHAQGDPVADFAMRFLNVVQVVRERILDEDIVRGVLDGEGDEEGDEEED